MFFSINFKFRIAHPALKRKRFLPYFLKKFVFYIAFFTICVMIQS